MHVKNQDPIASTVTTVRDSLHLHLQAIKHIQIHWLCSNKNLLITCLYKAIIYFFNCSIIYQHHTRSYRYFSIVLKVILSLSDRYKLFTNDWLWIEVCQNIVFSKIDITMTTMNQKTWNSIKSEFCAISRPAAENPATET